MNSYSGYIMLIIAPHNINPRTRERSNIEIQERHKRHCKKGKSAANINHNYIMLCLEPSNTLHKEWRQAQRSCHATRRPDSMPVEMRLVEPPQSLYDLVAFLENDHRYCIWISEHAYVSCGFKSKLSFDVRINLESPPRNASNFKADCSRQPHVCCYADTSQAVAEGLASLLMIFDDYFIKLSIEYNYKQLFWTGATEQFKARLVLLRHCL